jgi:hypothetical protein
MDNDKENNDESISEMNRTTSYSTDFDSVVLQRNQTDRFPRKATEINLIWLMERQLVRHSK